MNNFVIYLIGVALVAGAIGYAAYLIGLGPVWIGIITVIIIGFGIMGAVKKTQKRE